LNYKILLISYYTVTTLYEAYGQKIEVQNAGPKIKGSNDSLGRFFFNFEKFIQKGPTSRGIASKTTVLIPISAFFWPNECYAF
jgi:hypothetical protein